MFSEELKDVTEKTNIRQNRKDFVCGATWRDRKTAV